MNFEGIKMNEQWAKWEPIQGLASNYCIDGMIRVVERIIYENPIQDNTKAPAYLQKILSNAVIKSESSSRFVIFLSNGNNSVQVTFDSALISYRCTPAQYRAKLIQELEKQHETHFHDWAFFKVKNSSYLKWLLDQSYEIINVNSFHFSFVGRNLIVEVVANWEPTVEIDQK